MPMLVHYGRFRTQLPIERVERIFATTLASLPNREVSWATGWVFDTEELLMRVTGHGLPSHSGANRPDLVLSAFIYLRFTSMTISTVTLLANRDVDSDGTAGSIRCISRTLPTVAVGRRVSRHVVSRLRAEDPHASTEDTKAWERSAFF